MKRLTLSLLTLLIEVVALDDPSMAQMRSQTGSISGFVLSAEDSSGLIGANIILQNTFLGTVSGSRGEFFLRRVPAGDYSLTVSIIGYRRKLIPNVRVKEGSTLHLLVELSPLPIQTEAMVVTATKHEEGLQEVPASVSVIDARTIMSRNAATVDDALQYVPGVRMLQNQVDIRGYTGYSRGAGSRVLLLMDGLPLLTGDTGEIVWEAIPVGEIERIEVVKGATSALYGSSALGGVINIITRDIPSTPQTGFRIYSGFYDRPFYSQWVWSDKVRGREGVYLTHSQRVGDLSFLAYGGYGGDDGYRENDSYRKWNGFAKLEYDFSPFERLTLLSNFVHQREATFYYWKSLDSALVPDISQEGSHVTTTRWNTDFSFRKFVSDEFSYVVRGEYFSSFLQYDSAGVPGSSSLANVANFEFQGNYELAHLQRLTFGVVGNLDQVNARQYGSHFGYGSAAYVQDELQVAQPLGVTAGLRYDLQTILGLPSWNRVSPKLGLVFSASPATTLRASIGGGFRAPAIAEMYVNTATSPPIVPNPDLKPEQSWSYELGVTHFFSESLMLDGALFRSDFSNLIEAGFDSTGGKLRIMFDNVSRARVEGGELDMKLDLFKKLLHFDLGYTYTWPEDLASGTILKFRSRHLLYSSVVLNYKIVSLGFDFRYISKIEKLDEILSLYIVDWDKRVPIEVADARASIDLTRWGFPITLGLHVNNLFQYDYVEIPGNLGPIRNYVLSLEGKLE